MKKYDVDDDPDMVEYYELYSSSDYDSSWVLIFRSLIIIFSMVVLLLVLI